MRSLVLFVSAFLLVSPALGIKYTNCGSGSEVTDVEVEGCEGKDVCPLKRGSQAKLTIKFNSKSSTKSLTAVVHGIIGGVPMPFPIPQADACSGCGLNCPLKSGQGYVYSTELDVKSSYPPLSVTVEWELRDENNGDVVCVKIPSVLT